MKFKKIPYYFFAFISLFRLTKNKLVFFKIFSSSNKKIILRNELEFIISNPMDFLILKETIIDDVYKVRNLKNAKYIIDIGAGFGDFCIFAAKEYPQAIIRAFEPNPYLYKLLLLNIKINKLKNIIPQQKAISVKQKVCLFIQKFGTNSSLYLDKKEKETVMVEGARLSNFFQVPVDLLKIDCEGAELEILSSLKKDYFKKIKKINLEYHANIIPQIKEKIVKLLSPFYNYQDLPDPYLQNLGLLYFSLKL